MIPDANGTGILVTISCQSNHMKWNARMIWYGRIGFLGVSAMLFGATARSAGHHSYRSVLLRGCSGPLCTSSITENIRDWRTHSVPDSGKRSPSFARKDAAFSTDNPRRKLAKLKSRSMA